MCMGSTYIVVIPFCVHLENLQLEEEKDGSGDGNNATDLEECTGR